MLLNANTATRSFRELRFDLIAFLQALRDICPVENTSNTLGIVEIKWADGSVDIVPTYRFIYELVGTCYSELRIGDTAVLSASSVGPRESLTLLLNGAALSAHIAHLGGPSESLTFVRGVIRNLVADVVTLDPSVSISGIHVDGILHAEECSVTTAAADYLEASTMYVQESADISRVTGTPPMQFLGGTKDISVCVYAPAVVTGSLLGGYTLTGPMRYAAVSADGVQALFNTGNPQISVEVPVLPAGTQGSSGNLVYVVSAPEAMPSDMTQAFPTTSLAGMMLLYPKKAVRSMGSVSNVYMRVTAPVADDEDHIVQICNNYGMAITACNAWQFRAASDGATGTGSVSPLSYVTLPPLSSVDFLFKFEIIGSRLCVYMLPMRTLDL